MKEIKYNATREETPEEIRARALITTFKSANNPENDDDTSENRIHNTEAMNRVLAQRDRIKRTTKKRRPIRANAGDIAYAMIQDGYHERKEGKK